MDRQPPSKPDSPTPAPISTEERAVLQAIRDTNYGAVEIVLHQSRIVQIVKTERVRLEGAPLPT